MNTSIYLMNPNLTGDLRVSVGDESVMLNSGCRCIEFDIDADTEITVEYLCAERTLSYECKKIRNPISRLFSRAFGGLFGTVLGALNFLYDDKMKKKRIYNLLKTVNPFDIRHKFTLHGGEKVKLTVLKPKLDTENQIYEPTAITVEGAGGVESGFEYNSKYFKGEVMPPFALFFAIVIFLAAGIGRIPVTFLVSGIIKYETVGNLFGIIISALFSLAFFALVVYAAFVMVKYYEIIKTVDKMTKGEAKT